MTKMIPRETRQADTGCEVQAHLNTELSLGQSRRGSASQNVKIRAGYAEQPHHGDDATDEAEVMKMAWVDGGLGIDLKLIVVAGGVLEETVHRV